MNSSNIPFKIAMSILDLPMKYRPLGARCKQLARNAYRRLYLGKKKSTKAHSQGNIAQFLSCRFILSMCVVQLQARASVGAGCV